MKKFIKDMLKSFTCGALIGSICCCYVANVTAASSNGEPTRDTINGVSYTMQNSISNGNRSANAYTFNAASQVVGTGCLAVRPILLDENGNVKALRDWIYSDSNTSGMSASAGTTYYTSDYYYSYGYARVWNGSDYNEYRPGRTPNIRFE